jgi:hypothetical protein
MVVLPINQKNAYFVGGIAILANKQQPGKQGKTAQVREHEYPRGGGDEKGVLQKI